MYVAPEAAGPLLADTAGAAADGAFVISPAPVGPDVTGASIVPQGVTELGAYGVMAYDATKHVLAAVQAAAGKPTREGIRSSLRQVRSVGLTGDIAFGPSGLRESPPSWLYQIEPGGFPGASAGQVAP